MKRQLSLFLIGMLNALWAVAATFNLNVTVTPYGAATLNRTGGTYEEGTQISLYTNPHSGYVFQGWYDGDELLSQDRSFTYVMPDRDVTLRAAYVFDPEVPADPSMPDTTTYYGFTADVSPYGSGTVSLSAGRYAAGRQISIYTSNHTGFKFLRWVDDLGVTVSEAKSFKYTMPARQARLTAIYEFDPDVPGDPEAAIPHHTLTLYSRPADGCTFNFSVTSVAEGAKQALRVYPRTGFHFLRWEDADGNFVSDKANFDYEMPQHDMILYAILEFDPDVPDDPTSDYQFVVTPDDTEGWNDLTLPHRIMIEGTFSDDSGQAARIQYSVEDSGKWFDLTGDLAQGTNYSDSVVVNFFRERPQHTIHLRLMHSDGTTAEMDSISYRDIRFVDLQGVADRKYSWGEPLTQDKLVCELPDGQYVIGKYADNVNAGTASFYIEGVYPYTIGRRRIEFAIAPVVMEGGIELTSTEYVYNGSRFYPEWHFTDPLLKEHATGRDYYTSWENNLYPGTATLRVTGINNFTGEITATFTIAKAPLTDNLYSLTLPDSDVLYDGKEHRVSFTKAEGVGAFTFFYVNSDGVETVKAPTEPGLYDVYFEVADGDYYLGQERRQVCTFSIYKIDDEDWQAIVALNEGLKSRGWAGAWDLSAGPKTAPRLRELRIVDGKVVKVNFTQSGLVGEFPAELLMFKHLREINLHGNSLGGDVSTFAALKKQNVTLNFDSITNIDISRNQFTGNAGVMATAFPSLTSLNVSDNRITDVVPAISSKVTDLDLAQQSIDRTISLDLADLDVMSAAKEIPTILLYNHEGQDYSNPVNFRCATDDGWSMILTFADGQLSTPYVSEKNDYHGVSGDTLAISAVDNSFKRTMATMRLCIKFSEGDANFNGPVDLLDLQATLGFMFGEYVGRPFNFTAANLWTDEMINVQDIVCIVNRILESTVNSTAEMRVISDEIPETHASLVNIDGGIYLKSEEQVAAFDITVDGCGKMTLSPELKALGFDLVTRRNGGSMRGIAYSISGSAVPQGSCIVNIDGGELVAAMLSTLDAREIPVSLNGPSTGLDRPDAGKPRLTVTDGVFTVDGCSAGEKIEWRMYTPDGVLVSSGIGICDGHVYRLGSIPVRRGIYVVDLLVGQRPLKTKVEL